MRAPEVGGGTLDPVRTCTGKRPSAAARGRPSAVTRPGERAGQHHDRGVGRLRGQQLPPPDLQLRRGGTGLSAPCRPPRRGPPSPLEAARAFVAASNSTPRADVRAASREAHGRGGRGGSRKVREGEREGREGLQVDSDKTRGPFCKNVEEHVATCGSAWSRKGGRARRTNVSLRNPNIMVLTLKIGTMKVFWTIRAGPVRPLP